MKGSPKSNIIFLTDSFPPLHDATSRINKSLIIHLCKNNNVEIVCPYLKSQSKFNYPKNFKIRRLLIPFVKTRNIYRKFIKFIIFSILATIYLIFKGLKKDIIIIHTSPPILILIAIIPIKILDFFQQNTPKIFLIAHDLYPDIIFRNSKNGFYRISSKIFKISYHRFDKIISCCDSINNKFLNIYKINKNKLEIIYCSSLIPRNLICDNHNINFSTLKKNKPKILLMGNIGELHLPQDIINSFTFLLKKIPDLEFNTYITGGKANFLNNNFLSFKNFKSFPLVNEKNLSLIYQQPIISLISLSKAASNAAFPSRISTALSLGSPILLFTDILDKNYLVDFVKQNNIGVFVSYNSDKKNIIKAFKILHLDFKKFSQNAKNTYKLIFDQNKNFKKIDRIILKSLR